jgi:hypothetical protein
MKSIFISHITEEAPLASVLKMWLESTFPESCKVFVSSDPSDLPPGTKWLDHIDCALRDAEILLVLCSRTSLPRPWINFETGCAWMKKISIIPICHSGITVNTLPRPLSEFQALNLESSNFVNQLIEGVGRQLGLTKYPKIDTNAMTRALVGAQQAAQRAVSLVGGIEGKVRSEISLGETAMDVLKVVVVTSGDGIFVSELRKQVNIPDAKLTYYLEKLADAGFIVGDWVRETPMGPRTEWRYWATKDGRRCIFDSEGG